jgi:16S rRNA (cytosine1402-N4)-methyltransferase
MDNAAFYHTTVLLQEAVDGLAIKEEGVYVDATMGGGGHTKEILKRLNQNGKLIAFDQDDDAWRNQPKDERLIAVKENFRYLKPFLKLNRALPVDGILADLGVSSFQFDTAERGFSIRFEGALDMRMDRRITTTAEKILKEYSESMLHTLFEQNGEVRNAKQLAKHIVLHRNKGGLSSIESFKAMITPVMKGLPNKYLAQVFQALRIEVNDELNALKEFLNQAYECLKPNGRLSIITFHSLEDRIVKQFIKKGNWEEEQQTDIFGRVTKAWNMKAINNKPIEPSAAELKNNPRSRSARLRIAEKL